MEQYLFFSPLVESSSHLKTIVDSRVECIFGAATAGIIAANISTNVIIALFQNELSLTRNTMIKCRSG
jgi:hypothetical protein